MLRNECILKICNGTGSYLAHPNPSFMAIISLERFPFKIRFLFLKSVNGSEKDDVTQRLWFRNVAAALTVVWGQLWRLAGTTIGGWRGRPWGAGGDDHRGLVGTTVGGWRAAWGGPEGKRQSPQLTVTSHSRACSLCSPEASDARNRGPGPEGTHWGEEGTGGLLCAPCQAVRLAGLCYLILLMP